MKSIKICIILFILFFFSSCISNRIDKANSDLSIIFNEVKYEVIKVGKMSFTNNYGGGGYFISKDSTTKEKGRFFQMEILIENNSSETKEVNLKELFICDQNKKCLVAHRIDVKSFVDIPANEILKLKPKEKFGRKLIFSGPKSFIPKFVLINNEKNIVIEFKYK